MLPFGLADFRSAPLSSSEPGIVIYLLDTSAISALMRSDATMASWLSSVSAGDLYATVKSGQQRCGLPLDENDLWIAATALALGATLISNDSDFQSIETLAVLRP